MTDHPMASEIDALVRRISCPEDRRIEVGYEIGTRIPYVQVSGLVRDLTDTYPGAYSWQAGRKVYIHEFMTEGAFFQMCLDLLIAFEAHETREAFRVDGCRVFGPHIRLSVLQTVCDEVEL